MTHVNAVRPLRDDNARPPPGQSSRIEEGGSDEGTNERDERDVDYSPTNHGGMMLKMILKTCMLRIWYLLNALLSF